MDVPIIFDRSVPGRRGVTLPALDVPSPVPDDTIPTKLLRRTPPRLPEVSELDAVRHYTFLSTLNFGVDSGFYPLGSCTMKYNPKVNEWAANLAGFADLHPLQPESTLQGVLGILHSLEEMLKEICGMDALSLQPAAGAQGELTGILMIKAFLRDRGERERSVVIVPDSAHGTNPASAAMAGFEVRVVDSNRRGGVDVQALARLLDGRTAGLMLTNPNTLGLFEEDIMEIADRVHRAGGLLYYDGANANAILGKVRPGDMGFDLVHLNLHKTFSTPHGGGGPGAGPVGARAELAPYLPGPRLAKVRGQWRWVSAGPRSIGKVRSHFGNVGTLIRAYAYLRSQGAEGLETVAESAVLNANYLMAKLAEHYETRYPRRVKHEFVLSLKRQKARGAKAMDVAKRLIDLGFYPPTVYFPLVVEEAMMVEPTETESKQTLDRFAEAMARIDREIDTDPETVRTAPHETVVSRLDEARAARSPKLRWQED